MVRHLVCLASACLSALSIIIYSSLCLNADPGLATVPTYPAHSKDIAPLSPIPLQSLTAILPIVPRSLNRIPETLLPFLKPSKFIREIIIVCPESIATRVRQILQKTVVSIGTTDHPDVSLHPWVGHLDPAIGVLRAISGVSTVWVLLMDDQGLLKVVDSMRSLLLHPPQFPVPFGPTGVLRSNPASNATHHLGRARLAMYLRPPFVMPVSLGIFPTNIHDNGNDPWASLGLQVSKHQLDAIGGIIVSDEDCNSLAHFAVNHKLAAAIDTPSDDWPLTSFSSLKNSERRGTFVFFLLVLDDIRNVAHLICRMQTKDQNSIRIFVYGEYVQSKVEADWVTGRLEMERCILTYQVLVTGVTLSFSRVGSDILSRWFDTFDDSPDVIVVPKELDPLVGYLLSNHQDLLLWDATLIQIPRFDLKYTEWMSSLTLIEWKSVVNSLFGLVCSNCSLIDWHRPRVDISIITKDRPHSFTRLLNSLLTARYFGDHLDLRVNMDQDCDEMSYKIADQIIWSHGHVFIHHRIMHGGLLPAVVESWFPHTNDSYGLLLEDDIELSPMFYAWVKMAVLRYRYLSTFLTLFCHYNTFFLLGMAIIKTKFLICLASVFISRNTLSFLLMVVSRSTRARCSHHPD